MKRKLISMVLILVMIITTLTGCSNDTNERIEDNNKVENENSDELASKDDDKINNQDKNYPKELVVTYVTSPLNVPSIIDEEKDIFDDEFEKLGIDVEYAEITSGADQTQALASGDVHILYGVGASSVILSAANGADIKILNAYSRSPKAFCIYSKDKKITSPKDLKGKKIAGPTGTNLHELLASYLAKENMNIKDVEYINMSISEAKTALDSGRVDVALLAGTTAYEASKQGYNLVTDGEGLVDALIVVAVKEDFYNKYPKLIEKIKLSQDKISDFIEKYEDDALKLVADELDLQYKDVKDMYKYYDFSTKISDEDKKSIQKTADFMYKFGMIDKEFDTNKLYLK